MCSACMVSQTCSTRCENRSQTSSSARVQRTFRVPAAQTTSTLGSSSRRFCSTIARKRSPPFRISRQDSYFRKALTLWTRLSGGIGKCVVLKHALYRFNIGQRIFSQTGPFPDISSERMKAWPPYAGSSTVSLECRRSDELRIAIITRNAFAPHKPPKLAVRGYCSHGEHSRSIKNSAGWRSFILTDYFQIHSFPTNQFCFVSYFRV